MNSETGLISSFREEIIALNPMDSGFIFKYRRWKDGFVYDKSFIDLFKHFDERKITRRDVITSFREYFQDNTNAYYIPFLLAMIWGYGKSGFGPVRTNKYFATDVNLLHIENAMRILAEKKPYEAYAELLLINGLNVSFASKIVYFATRALQVDFYPLIFDRRVAASLINLFTNSEISQLVDIMPRNDLKSYKSYNILLHRWAKEIGVEAENIELFLFNENRK